MVTLLTHVSERTMTAVIGNGMAMAAIIAVMAYTADTIVRTPDEAQAERQARKEEVRKRFRRPINELVNEVGEGRGTPSSLGPLRYADHSPGIYPPGYDERRKQRMKERYGIEIQEPYYKGEPANN